MKEPEFYELLKRFGERINYHRKTNGQKLLDIEILTGISSPDLSKLENGREDENPELYTLFRIAKALNIHPKKLLE